MLQSPCKNSLNKQYQQKKPQEDTVIIPEEALFRQFFKTPSHGDLQEIRGLLMAEQKYSSAA